LANKGLCVSESKVDFSIVIPAYNEAGAIGSVLERLGRELDTLEKKYEIVVVSDGSTDATADEVRAVGGAVRLVEHPYNMGNGAAIKTGIRQSHGEILICMDADGQHAPEDISRFLEGCQRYDMVVGARSSASQAGWHRSLANRLYNAFASYVTGRRIEDLTSGYRAMRRSVASRFVGLLPNGFSYPTTITLCMLRAGFSVDYIPIEAAKRVGKSKIRVLSDGPKFLMVIMKICMLFSPLKIFLPVSLYLFLMGVGYYGYTFFTVHRFTNMSMLLFMTSVMVFMMGLIAEQVAQMRSERSEGH
jgi:glycosyltransferase involved in cell wall biosynthesis